MMGLVKWYQNWQIQWRISQLSNAERQEIIEKSPYEAAGFQGEGYHVFLKSNPDYYEGYITSLGEISWRDAEDWLIKQYFLEADKTAK